MNERFRNAIEMIPQATPPVWMMRQAGRYHRHYQALRKNHTFLELCRNPKLAAETALGPIQDFDFDLAILFSDILFPLDALGMGLYFEDAGGPKLRMPLTPESLLKLNDPMGVVDQLAFQKEALIETRKVLPKDKSLIGFVGGPFTLFTYATQGSHKGGMKIAKTLANQILPQFYEHLMPLLKENIRLQLEGGAEVVMILDTAAGELAPDYFQTWALEPAESLARAFPGKIGYYSKELSESALSQCLTTKSFKGLGLDHRHELTDILHDPSQARPRAHFIQGNFDPEWMFLPAQDFDRVLWSWILPLTRLTPEERRGWVCGLGHGILPQTPEDNVRSFVKRVREVFS